MALLRDAHAGAAPPAQAAQQQQQQQLEASLVAGDVHSMLLRCAGAAAHARRLNGQVLPLVRARPLLQLLLSLLQLFLHTVVAICCSRCYMLPLYEHVLCCSCCYLCCSCCYIPKANCLFKSTCFAVSCKQALRGR